MQMLAVLALMFAVPALSSGDAVSPTTKVIEMLSDLETKIIGEGGAAQKVYEEFAEYCEDRSRSLQFDIKTGRANIADLKATIEEEDALILSLDTKIEELSGALAIDEGDLKAATDIRASEHAAFSEEQHELVGVIDTLERAIQILEKKPKAIEAMMQMKGVNSLVQVIGTMVQASAFSAADGEKLTALVQNSASMSDGDVNAPAEDVFTSSTGNIIETLSGLNEKASAQLDEARKTETSNFNNFKQLQQSIQDEIKYGNIDMARAQKAKATAQERKAAAEGDLAVSSKDVASDVATLGDLHQDCMTKAAEFEASTQSRASELKALEGAKAAIKGMTGGASDLTYSLAQVESKGSSVDALRFVRELARDQKSSAIARLASQISSVMQFGAGSKDDQFAKVKGLIADLLASLEKQAAADQKHEEWCRRNLAETKQRQADKTNEIAKMTTHIDQMTARSAQLKEEVATLEKELSAIATAQATMDKLREKEHSTYVSDEAELTQGIEGVKMALSLLQEYYASEHSHAAADGAGQGIIGLLEVVESDFTKNLAETVSAEQVSLAAYVRETKDNQVETATKNTDVKFKTQESTSLDKSTSETKTDRDGVEEELANVEKWLKNLNSQCTETVIPFAEKQARMKSEVAGLKQALTILENEGVNSLIQTRALRQVHAHTQPSTQDAAQAEAEATQPSTQDVAQAEAEVALAVQNHKLGGVCLMSSVKFQQQTQDGASDWIEHSDSEEDICLAQNFIKVQFCGAGTLHVFTDGVCGSGQQSIVHGATKIISDCQELDFTNGMSFMYECIDGVGL